MRLFRSFSQGHHHGLSVVGLEHAGRGSERALVRGSIGDGSRSAGLSGREQFLLGRTKRFSFSGEKKKKNIDKEVSREMNAARRCEQRVARLEACFRIMVGGAGLADHIKAVWNDENGSYHAWKSNCLASLRTFLQNAQMPAEPKIFQEDNGQWKEVALIGAYNQHQIQEFATLKTNYDEYFSTLSADHVEYLNWKGQGDNAWVEVVLRLTMTATAVIEHTLVVAMNPWRKYCTVVKVKGKKPTTTRRGGQADGDVAMNGGKGAGAPANAKGKGKKGKKGPGL